MDAKKILFYGLSFIVLVALGSLYERRSIQATDMDHAVYKEIVDRHYYNESMDFAGKVPIWIPIAREENGRYWPSFGSRLTKKINKPYLNLCIESIVKNAGPSYEVVIVDDDAYSKLIPNWSVDLSLVA